MGNREIPQLYQQYFIDKHDERKMLFKKITELYQAQKGIYPGSFVHITPSFYIQDMTYIDSDKRISSFFENEKVLHFIEKNKQYNGRPSLHWYQADFSTELAIDKHSCDVMFSFYAGFISQSCKQYLKNDGILICNNSHGDASLAFVDGDYELLGVIKRNGARFSITDKDLHTYFKKKDGSSIDKNKIRKRMVGENFTKKGYAYIFKLCNN